MANLRIIHDNAAARATITASSQAGALGPANLITGTKSAVWRSTSTDATLSLAFAQSVLVGGVVLPFCNLTAGATMRMIGYDARGVVVVDTGTVRACAPARFGAFDWGLEALGINAYRRGGVNEFSQGAGAYACAWMAQTAVRNLNCIFSDPGNPDGYIEAAQLVAGNYWSPHYNAAYGASVQSLDTSTQYRTDGGDMRVARGSRSRRLSLSLEHLTPADRARLMSMLRRNGLSMPVFVSLFPESDDARLEQDHQIYGRLSELSAMTIPYLDTYSAPLAIEEM